MPRVCLPVLGTGRSAQSSALQGEADGKLEFDIWRLVFQILSV